MGKDEHFVFPVGILWLYNYNRGCFLWTSPDHRTM